MTTTTHPAPDTAAEHKPRRQPRTRRVRETDWLERRIAPQRTPLLLLLLLATALLYTHALKRSPPHFNQDELGHALNGYAISQTGRDNLGRWMPVFFRHLDAQDGTSPVQVYLLAALYSVAPLAEETTRIPNAVVGVLSVLCVYFFARALFKRETEALIAASILALNPAHFMNCRLAVEHPLIIPFLSIWLYFMTRWLDSERPLHCSLAGMCLGIGFYVDSSSKITTSLFFALSLAAVWHHAKEKRRDAASICSGFGIALVPFFFYFLENPRMFRGIIEHADLYDANAGAMSGAMVLLSPDSLRMRFSVFLNYFNPVFLFLTGDSAITQSSQKTGTFLYACAVFIPCGVYFLVREKRPVMSVLLPLVYALAPVAASVAGEHFRVCRAFSLLPAGAVLSAFAVCRLLRAPDRRVRWGGFALLLSMPLQFGYFVSDYFSDYPKRAYSGGFNLNIPDAFEAAIEQNPQSSPALTFVDKNVRWAEFYWKFFGLKHHRNDLLDKMSSFDSATIDLGAVPSGSFLIYRVDSAMKERQQIEAARLFVAAEIPEPDGRLSFVVFQKL